MSKDWRFILRFAIVGLAVAAMFCAFFKTDSLAESWAATWMSWESLAICPGYFAYILAVAGGGRVADTRFGARVGDYWAQQLFVLRGCRSGLYRNARAASWDV